MLIPLTAIVIVFITGLWLRKRVAESIYDGFMKLPSWPLVGNISYFWSSNHDEAMVRIANEVMKENDAFVYRHLLSSK